MGVFVPVLLYVTISLGSLWGKAFNMCHSLHKNVYVARRGVQDLAIPIVEKQLVASKRVHEGVARQLHVSASGTRVRAPVNTGAGRAKQINKWF